MAQLWAPDTHKGNLHWCLGSRLCNFSSWSCCGYLGNEAVDGNTFAASQVDKEKFKNLHKAMPDTSMFSLSGLECTVESAFACRTLSQAGPSGKQAEHHSEACRLRMLWGWSCHCREGRMRRKMNRGCEGKKLYKVVSCPVSRSFSTKPKHSAGYADWHLRGSISKPLCLSWERRKASSSATASLLFPTSLWSEIPCIAQLCCLATPK